jgi:hypothetical protein
MKQLLLIIYLMGFSAMYAQTGQNPKHADKVNAHKIAYITEKVGLSESEAQRFWPLYNSYQNDKENLKAQAYKNITADMSDREAEDQLGKYLDARARDVEMQKKFIDKLRAIMPARKILLLIEAERSFKVEILSKMSDKCKPGS